VNQPVRVLLLEDEELVRVSIKMILESSGRIDVVADRADGVGAVDLVREHKPDVVVTDIRMPTVDGLAVTREVRALPEPPPVLLLTTFDLDEYVYEALAAGAAGFLLKDTPPRDLVSGVEVVANGNAVLAPSVIRRMVTRFASGAGKVSTSNKLDVLTDREREVVRLVATGAGNADIAARLLLSEATVKVHVRHATAKLGLDNRTQLAILVYQENDTL
jgi:DNA-binding NarL/FixJ family response regulator